MLHEYLSHKNSKKPNYGHKVRQRKSKIETHNEKRCSSYYHTSASIYCCSITAEPAPLYSYVRLVLLAASRRYTSSGRVRALYLEYANESVWSSARKWFQPNSEYLWRQRTIFFVLVRFLFRPWPSHINELASNICLFVWNSIVNILSITTKNFPNFLCAHVRTM